MVGKRVLQLLLIALIVSSAGPGAGYTPASAGAQAMHDVEDVSVFYDALAPYGTWTTLPAYGQVWIPSGVPEGWRPYTHGRWVYTDYGWTWASSWEWGWAPFHYGRWTLVPTHGWVWLPGTVWAPAWVAWRHADGWVGWAPLPLEAGFHAGGFVVTDAHVGAIPPSWFAFVEARWLLSPRLHVHVVHAHRNAGLIHNTRNITHYTVVGHRLVNRCLPVEHVEHFTARPVPRMRLVERHTPAPTYRSQVRDREREVVVYRPPQPRQAPVVQQYTQPQPLQQFTQPSSVHQPGPDLRTRSGLYRQLYPYPQQQPPGLGQQPAPQPFVPQPPLQQQAPPPQYTQQPSGQNPYLQHRQRASEQQQPQVYRQQQPTYRQPLRQAQ